MGQKINPNFFRLGITKDYFYKYLEKKSSELPLYDFNILEIKKFTYKFFENNKLKINTCKISYSNDNILRFFISYYAVPNYTTRSNKKKQQKLKKLAYYSFPNFYSTFKYTNNFKKRIIPAQNGKFFGSKLRNSYFDNGIFNNKFLLKKSFPRIQSNYFLNNFCDSISKFLNKNIKISIICTQLNAHETKKLDKRTLGFLKRSFSSLFFFKRHSYYKEGINILFLCAQRPDLTTLLISYLASNLPKQKHHVSFIKFIMQTLVAFKKNNKFSKIETVKIKLKGRINRKPRAKHRFFALGHKRLLPTLSVNSKIHFSEKTSFTPNGTLGLRIWSLGSKTKKQKNNNLNFKTQFITLKNERKVFPFISKKFLPKTNITFNKITKLYYSNDSKINFGDMAIVSSQKGYINKTQLEATKLAIKRILKRDGKVWQKMFPTLIVTGKSKGSRMGKGKGKIKYLTCFIKKSGTVIFEVTGTKRATVLKALEVGKAKLPIKTSIV